MRERILALALAGCAIAVSPAAAAAPAFRTPDQSALRALGVDVAWPAAQSLTDVASGSRVAVDVRRVRRGRSGRLALIAVSANGRPIRLVAHRALRPGRFAVRLPARPGARYLLALDLDGRRFASPVTTQPPPPPTPPPPPAPPAGPAPCNGPAEAATLAFPGPSAHAGDQVLATLVNTGKSCFSYHALVDGWQREQWDGTWVDVAAPYPGYP